MTDYKEQNNNEYKQQAVCPTYTDVTLSQILTSVQLFQSTINGYLPTSAATYFFSALNESFLIYGKLLCFTQLQTKSEEQNKRDRGRFFIDPLLKEKKKVVV